MLRNFDTELDRQGVARQTTTVAPTVIETVAVSPLSDAATTWLLVDPAEWTWRELRDYVVHQAESRFGPQQRNAAKEAGILRAFLKRWGPLAPEIARYVFEISHGRWMGQPIYIERFTKAQDHCFASRIAERIRET